MKSQLKTVRTVSRPEACSTRPLIAEIWVWFQAVFSVAQQPPVPWGLLIIEDSQSQWDTPYSLGLLRTSDLPVAETSTWQHTTHSQETVIHAPGGIWTHNPGKQAGAELRLSPHGHWDRRFQFIPSWIYVDRATMGDISIRVLWF